MLSFQPTISAIGTFSNELLNRLRRYKSLPVILCIGSDKIVGDCLGPLIGHLLVCLDIPCYVYGTLERPVTAKNLKQTLDFISIRHSGCKVWAIDASVGRESKHGIIKLHPGGIYPGSAFNKNLPKVGSLGITSVLGEEDFLDTRLYSVWRSASFISLALSNALKTHILASKLYNTKAV